MDLNVLNNQIFSSNPINGIDHFTIIYKDLTLDGFAQFFKKSTLNDTFVVQCANLRTYSVGEIARVLINSCFTSAVVSECLVAITFN